MRNVYDCHSHEVFDDRGGFLIALDGRRGSSGGYSNKEVIKVAQNGNMLPVQYIVEGDETVTTKIIKIHPRREKLDVGKVKKIILEYAPNGVILDTLDQPFWIPNDYWKVSLDFPDTQFLFSHAGGYDLLEFLKIAKFQKNVWIDFSFTQHIFGWCGRNVEMPYIMGLIRYAMSEPDINRKLLLGSDNERDKPDTLAEIIESYQMFASFDRVAKENFESFVGESKL